MAKGGGYRLGECCVMMSALNRLSFGAHPSSALARRGSVVVFR
jgi:hypothetical protein